MPVSSSTVGMVGKRSITSRDVQISSIMDHWFLSETQQASALLKTKNSKSKKNNESASAERNHKDWILDEKSEAFRKQLSTVMAEYLIVAEAENFSVARLSAAEVEKSANAMLEDLKSWSDWESLELSKSELESHVSRRLRAKEFLKFKTESMGLQVSDDEAKKYYDKNRARFSNLPYENFKEGIKEYIASRDVETKMKDWFDTLRKKYKVKVLQFEK